MGISRQAFDEVLDIIGRQPTIDELSTLLAMWESNGKQQSLYGWLRGQHHVVERNDYLYEGQADHKAIREPKVRECVQLASELMQGERLKVKGASEVDAVQLTVLGEPLTSHLSPLTSLEGYRSQRWTGADLDTLLTHNSQLITLNSKI